MAVNNPDPNSWDPITPTPPDQLPGYNPPPWGGSKPGQPTAPATPAVPTYPPGSDIYDWYRVNEALIAAGLNGWQIAGASHSPVNQGRWIQNPEWQSTGNATADAALNQGKQQYIWQQGNEWVIGVTNPATGQMLKLTMGRQGGDQPGQPYAFAITGRQDQGAIDPANPGYKDVQRLPFQDGHQELWGTNTSTGAFERMPGQPGGLGTAADAASKGWNDIKQIERAQPDGSVALVWVGIPPTGGPPQDIPGLGTLRAAQHDNIRQVTRGGRQVYIGRNKTSGAWEEIPELGSEAAPVPTTTVAGTVYKPNPNAGQPGQPDFVRATGIVTANEGDTQWIDAGNGYVKQQRFHNGTWSDDPDIPWRPVSPETQRAAGAILPRGTRYEVPSQDGRRLITVVADGNGGYTIPSDTTSRPFPGLPIDKPVTPTTADQEFIVRYNPETGQQETVRNPNYQPTNAAQRVRQISQQANAKLAELQGRISSTYSQQQAQTDFDAWWQQNVEPVKQDIQRQQDIENLTGAREAMATAQAGATTGANLLNQRVSSATGMLQNLTNLAAGSKMTQVPAGLGAGLVTGIQDWVTGLGGGPGVYEAAANMVHNANPALGGTGIGAQATAAISQILERQANQRVNTGIGTYQMPGLPDVSQFRVGGGPQVVAPAAGVVVGARPVVPGAIYDPMVSNLVGPYRGPLSG